MSKYALNQVPPLTLLMLQLVISVVLLWIAVITQGIPVHTRRAMAWLCLRGVLKIGGVAGLIAGMIERLASLGYRVWRLIQRPWWCDQLSRAAGWPALPTRQPTFHTVCRCSRRREKLHRR